MKYIYVVFEDIDIDGGFGDAIPTISPHCAFETELEAKNFVKLNSNPQVYEKPYAELYSGGLHYRAVPIGGPIEEENLYEKKN